MSVGVASVPEIALPVDSLCDRLDGMLVELAEAVAGCVELRDVRGVTDRERIDRFTRLEQLKAAPESSSTFDPAESQSTFGRQGFSQSVSGQPSAAAISSYIVAPSMCSRMMSA